jgi:hypothetical protein
MSRAGRRSGLDRQYCLQAEQAEEVADPGGHRPESHRRTNPHGPH